jgi:outer membrane receptor protein involved in Fe transport
MGAAGRTLSFKWAIILGIFYLSAAVEVFAYEITGTIKNNETLESLSGANVTVVNTQLGSSTDRNGEFHISGLKPGEYKLNISMIGFKSVTKNITVPKDLAAIAIQLQPAVVQLQSVQVIGHAERNIIANPDVESAALSLSTSVIPRKKIQQQESKTLIEAMSYIPGAMVESRGRKVKQFFSIRGQRYPYPTFSLDGVWQKEFHETPYIFSASDIKSIEVVRSSAMLLTGLADMAGVINIETREYEKTETDYEVDYGSFNTFRGHFSHGSKINNLSYSVGIGYYNSNGAKDKHAAEQLTNFFGKIVWRPTPKLKLQTSAIHIYGKRKLVTAVPPAASKFQQQLEVYDPLTTTLLTAKATFTASDRMSTEFKASFADRKPTYDMFNTKTEQTARYKEEDHELNASLIQAISLIRNNTLRFGFIYNNWVAPEGKRFYYGKSCDTETFAGVIVDEHKFGKLLVDAGLRYERTYLNEYGAFGIDGSGKGFGTVSPIMDEWRAPNLNATLGFSYLVSESMSLIFHSALGSVSPREGTLNSVMQEPATESQFKFDAGIRKSSINMGELSLVGFFVSQKDAIYLTGKTATVNDRIFELYGNRNQQRFGLETEWRSPQLWKNYQLFVNAVALKSQREDNGSMEKNDEFPKFFANSGVFGQWKNWDINILAKYVSSYESVRFVASSATNPAQPQPLGEFFTLDFIIGWKINQTSNARVVFELRNATNNLYSTVVGYPDFGRRISLGIRQGW